MLIDLFDTGAGSALGTEGDDTLKIDHFVLFCFLKSRRMDMDNKKDLEHF